MPEAVLSTDCRMCGGAFEPKRPWWRICPGCFRQAPSPSAVARLHPPPDQLSLAGTVEWVEATSPNVVAIRSRRAA
jgi:hypothetical protein